MPNLSAREIALTVLNQYPGRAKPDELLEELLRAHDPERRERALATHLVSGTIKWRNRLDHIIKQLSHRSRVVKGPVLNILRLSLYQLTFLDKIPDYGAVNEGVKLAKQVGDRHQAAYVNAVLRSYLRDPEGITFPEPDKDPVRYLAVVYSHPRWLVRRWLERFGLKQAKALAMANNRIPAMGLRINRLKAGLEGAEQLLAQDGAEVVSRGSLGSDHIYVRGASPIEATQVHQRGIVQVQDASSTLVGRLLAPQAGTRVVDLCSAPGGKATHLYELVEGRATVVANDVSWERLRLVVLNADRLGHTGMVYCVSDGRKRALKDADFLLVDAPCTGLGVLARRWDLRWAKREKDIARMAVYQTELLLSAIDIVRKGGVVVYSTCSIEPEENEQVVETVIARRQDVQLSEIGRLVPESVVYKEGMIQTLPHLHGVDGIFAARLERF